MTKTVKNKNLKLRWVTVLCVRLIPVASLLGFLLCSGILFQMTDGQSAAVTNSSRCLMSKHPETRSILPHPIKTLFTLDDLDILYFGLCLALAPLMLFRKVFLTVLAFLSPTDINKRWRTPLYSLPVKTSLIQTLPSCVSDVFWRKSQSNGDQGMAWQYQRLAHLKG